MWGSLNEKVAWCGWSDWSWSRDWLIDCVGWCKFSSHDWRWCVVRWLGWGSGWVELDFRMWGKWEVRSPCPLASVWFCLRRIDGDGKWVQPCTWRDLGRGRGRVGDYLKIVPGRSEGKVGKKVGSPTLEWPRRPKAEKVQVKNPTLRLNLDWIAPF